MKIKHLPFVLFAAIPVTHAAVTVTPLLGYDFSNLARDNQRDTIKTSTTVGTLPAGSGVALESDIIAGLALGLEVTSNMDFEVEYQQINSMASNSKASITANNAYFDALQKNISGNFLLYPSMFGMATTKFRPYLLAGAGQSDIEIKDDAVAGASRPVLGGSKDTLVNVGAGAKYHFNRNMALRSEGRLAYNTDNSWVEPMVLLGVQWRIGKLQQPAAPTPVAVPVIETIIQPIPLNDITPVKPTVIGPSAAELAAEAAAKAAAESAKAAAESAKAAALAAASRDTDKDGVPDGKDQCNNSTMQAEVDANGCAKTFMPNGEPMVRVLFDTNKFFVKPSFYPKIKKVAEYLKENPTASATVEGHTDSRGSRAVNVLLSQNRAKAVRNILVKQYSVDPKRLKVMGYGPDRPVAPNTSTINLEQNRRTVVIETNTP